jgi:hypothetical protein
MKTAALLFMILDVIVLFLFGAFYLLGFAMSFDAPGSASDPKAWGTRLVMFVPVLLMIIALIIAVAAYMGGHFKQAFIISFVPVALGGAIYLFLMISSFSSMAKYRIQAAKDTEEARLHPQEKYYRKVDSGIDSIIVFPNRIVAYRKSQPPLNPFAGSLGDLNATRDTLYFDDHHDNKIPINELDQFTDDTGRKFTDVYRVINQKLDDTGRE